MKIQRKITVVSVAVLMMINFFPPLTVAADDESLEETGMMQESSASSEEETDCPVPDEAPTFSACIEYSHQGYIVTGTFMEFPPDISLVQPIYSLDGEDYQICGQEWDLHWLGDEDEDAKRKLQNQRCLYASNEPLKSYLDGKLDSFYLKLRLTKKDGAVYETQAAVIDRGEPQQLPEGIIPIAKFASNMLVRETKPPGYYGRYQITVRETAAWEEVSAFLPDMIPIEIQLQKGIDHVTEGFVECPVIWKSLALPELVSGESVIIPDAAEEIMIPGGILLNTPLGIFWLNEPIGIHQYALTDEIRLVLNVIAPDAKPTGVLSAENAGLEMAFNLKPTGATSIQAYTLKEGESKWVELPDVPFLNAVDSQPSTANSGYTLVLENNQEPYQSYREAEMAGNRPTPFFIGLKIKGGVYDGQELVLAWPDSYELPLDLPEMGGAGGNEGNAGADNKDDSTQEGQRPDLPKQDDFPDVVQAVAASETEGRTADSDSDIPIVAPVPDEQECSSLSLETVGDEKTEPVAADAENNVEGEKPKQRTLPIESETLAVSDSDEIDSNNEIYSKEEKPERETQQGSYGFLFPTIAVSVIVAGICIAIMWKHKPHTGS